MICKLEREFYEEAQKIIEKIIENIKIMNSAKFIATSTEGKKEEE